MVEWVFIIMLLLYLLVLVLIGFVNRRSSSLSDFFLASRSLTGNNVGLTLGATVVGGSAVIVTASLVFEYGISGLWYDIGGIMGLFLLGFYVAPKIRTTGAHSLPDLISISYGRSGGLAASVLLILVEIGWIALLLQASDFIISEAIGVSSKWALLISSGVFVFYTMVGGQVAVVRTDKLQIFLVLSSLMLIMMGLLANGATIRISSLEFPTTRGFTYSMVVSAFLVMFLSHVVGPDIYSKIFSSKGPKNASRGAVIGGLIKLCATLLVASIALLGISLYGDSISGGALLPTAARDHLPPLLFFGVMIGLLSVILSSADSCLLSGATFVSWDLIGGRADRFMRPFSVLVLGASAYWIANYSSGIIDTLELTYTMFSAGLIPAVILSVWKDRLDLRAHGVIASFIIGGGGVLVLHFLRNSGHWDRSLLFFPLGLSFIVLFLVSWASGLIYRR